MARAGIVPPVAVPSAGPSPKRRAGRAPLQGDPPRDATKHQQHHLHRGRESSAGGVGAAEAANTHNTNARRVIVPQLQELARRIPAGVLATVRTQVEPWEQVATYQRGREIRVVICGARRECRHAPGTLPGGWEVIGIVLVTDDGERPLPLEVVC